MKKADTFCRWLVGIALDRMPLLLLLMLFAVIPPLFSHGMPLWRYVFLVLPAQAFLIALVMVLLASLSKVLRIFVLSVAFVLFFCELMCLFGQNSRVTSSMVMILLQSNVSECGEYLGTIIWIFFGALGCVLAILASYLILEKYWSGRVLPEVRSLLAGNIRLNRVLCVVICIAALVSGFELMRGVKGHSESWQRSEHGMQTAIAPIAYYYAVKDVLFDPKIAALKILEKAVADVSVVGVGIEDPIHVVFVAGESMGRHRSSLYGYPLDVNPVLSKWAKSGNVLVFSDVVAKSNLTHEVYAPMLSLSDIDDPESFFTTPLLPSAMKKGGYHVRYFDNQGLVRTSSKFDFSCLYFFSRPEILKNSVDTLNDRIYDFDGDFISAYPSSCHIRKKNLYDISS